MKSKNLNFVLGEFYHVYNRGVDKRSVFLDRYDINRFLQSMIEFNSITPTGSLYELSFLKEKSARFGRETSKSEKLVAIVAYCLNPNHYHMILEQVAENGISEFMKRLGGYTKYFNHKYKRTGALFQGLFKSKYIDSNDYLLRLSVYVNLNDRIHSAKKMRVNEMKNPINAISSWDEYMSNTKEALCKKDIILDQFETVSEYQEFARGALEDIQKNKEESKELLLEDIP